MSTSAIFPTAPARAGMYESFYLRAVSPNEPVAVWIRNTVLKRPGRPPLGSVWCTVFDARWERPYMHKLTSSQLTVPRGGWIAVGQLGEDCDQDTGAHGQGGCLTPEHARGSCGQARWSLRIASHEPELRHLPRRWLYRTPLPRTKLTSPTPSAVFDGTLELAGQSAIEVRGWRGMVGHNWGSEHAERWIWLHGVDFEQAGETWLDLGLGRLRIAGRTTPWVANGALSLEGRRHRLGGLGARGLRVAEAPERCDLQVPGENGLKVQAHVEVPPATAAGWRYADPVDGEHDVVNCSVAAMTLTVDLGHGESRTLTTAHGAAYELGMRQQDHGVSIAPFDDG